MVIEKKISPTSSLEMVNGDDKQIAIWDKPKLFTLMVPEGKTLLQG